MSSVKLEQLNGRWGIRCDVEVIVSEQKFRFMPYPLELHNAIESEVGVIGKLLDEELDCPVFRGSP